MLDTLRTVETPEGIELGLRVAGPLPRMLAWLIDALIRFAVLYVLLLGLSVLGAFGVGLFLIATFLLEWLYPVALELTMDGQTVGKRALRLRVLCDDGTPVTLSASVVRNLLRAVDFLPLLYGLGVASMLSNRDFKRLGDLAGGTVVVYTDRSRFRGVIPKALPLTPPVALTAEEQQAVISFAERAGSLSPERARELASLAEPLGGASGAPTPERLVRMANWLAGGG
ncbi:MAG: RDD family protein [Chromatiales bacterium]|jgi:uncharacterized RDD family membrane protein YckC